MRVLIVEDNHVNQIVLVSMLRKLDAQTYTADHGANALTLLIKLLMLFLWIAKCRS